MFRVAESKQKGFTLLEVMIALSIISISLVVLFHSQNSNITRSYLAGTMVKAALVCREIMTDTDIAGKVSEGTWEGEREMDGITYSWKKTVEPSVLEGLKKIVLEVNWDGNDKELPFILETYRMK